MKSFVLRLVLLVVAVFSFTGPVEAKISFNWDEAGSVARPKRAEVERHFVLAAQKYLIPKYANLGPYDFVNSSETVIGIVMDGYEQENSTKAEYFPGVMGGTLFTDPSFFDHLNVFQVGVVHELCHAYDYIVTDHMKKDVMFFLQTRRLVGRVENNKAWYRTYLLKNEVRAFAVEEMYIEEIKGEMSADEYSRARKHLLDGKKAHGI